MQHMLTTGLALVTVLGVAKVVRDWLILREVRAAMEAGSAQDRVRIGMRLAEALGGGPSGPAPEQPGGEVVTPPR